MAAANTQALGISVDSVYCHANWAASLGGIAYPLLADFHPKGAVAESYGLYLGDKGITDRATVIIDAGGMVRHISAVGPGGERDISELVSLCENVDKAYEGSLESAVAAGGLPEGGVLYVKNNCAASQSALLAVDNLHVRSKLTVANVSDDTGAMDELKAKTGGEQAPALVIDGKSIVDSAEIRDYVVGACTAL